MKMLKIRNIAARNLAHRKVRTAAMTVFILLLSAVLFVSSMITNSMDEGLDRMVNRIGADIIAVPEAYAEEMRQSLFLGESCTAYCDSAYNPIVASMEGVEQMTPQLYIASLSAACCSLPTQIIAFDPKTDFVVSSWLSSGQQQELQTGQILVGSAIITQVGEELVFYEEPFQVAGALEPTGTGYDSCVFMSFETVKRLLATDVMRQIVPFDDPGAVVSALMIRTAAGADNKSIARGINYSDQNLPLKAYTASGMFSNISDNLASFSGYSTLLVVLLFAMAAAAVFCIFTITINERRRELGILVGLGASRGQLAGMVLTEAACIGLLGGLLGTGLAALVTFLFRDALASAFQIPGLLLAPPQLLLLFLQCMGIALAVSLLSAIYSVVRVGRSEPYTLIRSDE